MGGSGGGLGRPLLAACGALCAGAFFACICSRDAALALAAGALVCALSAQARLVAVGLALGLLRGALHERPRAISLPEEFEGEVVSQGVVRASGALVSLSHLPLHRGDRAVFFGHLHEPPPQLNPGGRDRRRDLAARGISLEGSAEVVRLLKRGPPLWRWLDDLRARFTARALLVCTTKERGALVAALGVGDRSAISPALEDDLAASGLVHLLASSGLHLAVVVLLIRELSRRIWLRTRWASRVRASAVASLSALPFAFAEVLLLGAPWPAVRAGLAAVLALLASATLRRPDALTTLALAAAGCALVDPAATHDLALQLSVLGIAGLLLLTRPLRELLPLRIPRLFEKPLMLGCATAAAALCTAPLLAASFHRVSLVSVFANALGLLPGLAAIPAATALVVVDWTPLWWLADLLSGATLAAAHGFAALPFATLRLAAPGLLACALWYAGVWLVSRQRYRWALAPWAALLAAACLPSSGSGMTLTFLAVGQGDSTIVQLPRGRAVLVDAGGDLRWPARKDPGARDVLPALAELGIRELDVVVLTHPHPDHAGGLLSVLDKIPVRELWMTQEQDAIATAVREKAREKHIPVVEPHALELGGVRVEVLSRFQRGRSLNDNSIVLRLVHGGVKALLAGDVEALAESELAQQDIEAQLLKAPHHGSRTSSTEAFLRRVHPAATVYCAGAGNPFGFPHPDVVARTPGAHWSTQDSAIIAESDGRSLTVRRFRE